VGRDIERDAAMLHLLGSVPPEQIGHGRVRIERLEIAVEHPVTEHSSEVLDPGNEGQPFDHVAIAGRCRASASRRC